jgi:G protein-coupled receptor kinase
MPITKNYFRVYRVLGKGGFGLVYACQSKTTGKMYALKKLEKKRVKRRHGEKLARNEKQVLERVSSRFVVSLAYAYQSKDSLCMILTLMGGGDLRFHIHNIGEPGLNEERTIFYAAEIACGLAHLHQARIAYRDMKPDNILLDDNGHVRISDLGLAVHIPDGQSVRGRVGTIGYMAPEVISNRRYTFQPDWWGLGCVVYEMIHGECPFRQRKERVTREEVEHRVREERERYTEKFSADAQLFCAQLLDKECASRLGCGVDGFSHVQAHPFFRTINWTHLLAGQVTPSFKPNARAVYARDVLDIDPFSSVKGVEIDVSDNEFAAKFSTGAVSEPWQQEMLENVFEEINERSPIESMTLESNSGMASPPSGARAHGGWLRKLFKRKKSSSVPSP